MTKSINEFKGKAGRIYVEKAGYDDRKPYEVWFEDLCILGDGDSEIEALRNAARHAADISILIAEALVTMESGSSVSTSGD